MRKLSTSVTILFVLICTSCYDGFFDQVPDDRLTLKETFSNKTTAEKFLAAIYRNIPNEGGQRYVGGSENSGAWTGASDEGEFVWSFVLSNNINIGAYDATSGFVQGFWNNFYQGIRSAGYFIDHVDDVTETEMTADLKKQYKAEARTLRAMFYFYLMRLYGPVILLGDEVLPPDAPAEDVQLPRNSFDECVEYVVNELDLASVDLPTIQEASEYGRINAGIAQAFKLKALLLAASPLFNGNTDYATMVNEDGKQLISQQYDASKWARAAQACKSFLNEFVPGVYDLYRKKKNDSDAAYDPYLSCRDLFLSQWNKEVILARAGYQVDQYEMTPYHQGYTSEARGSGAKGATQNMVDAFFMANGKSIDDPGSGYVESGFSSADGPYTKAGTYNQWVNREPRFYVDITYNGSTWLYTKQTIITELYNTGNSGKATGSNDYCPTGYVVRKGMGLGDWREGGKILILLRLGEIYLDYAEALNEADPGNPEIIEYVNKIRERAGIPLYGSADLPTPSSQEAVRQLIRKERRVELAFENSRYFDVRRWKIAEQTDNGPIYGLKIDEDMPEFLTVVPFENRVFEKKHYFFPIPQKDIDTDRMLVQNTGW